MRTISDVEAELTEKLLGPLGELGLLPAGYEAKVGLHGRVRYKKRTAMFFTSWWPETDCIMITFRRVAAVSGADSAPETPKVEGDPVEARPAAVESSGVPENAASSASISNCLSDLIRALDRAAARPENQFVALKRFRDIALPEEAFPWAKEYSARDRVLREAIEKRLILKSRVPNPKSPQFPVTAIRLNPRSPEVRAVLGNRDEIKADFHPVSIRGESLSGTILHDRR